MPSETFVDHKTEPFCQLFKVVERQFLVPFWGLKIALKYKNGKS